MSLGTRATVNDDALGRVTGSFAGFFGTWVMNIGRRARLFETLRERGPLSPSALAAELGYEKRYVETWCRGAYAFELLTHRNGTFALEPPVSEILLDASNPTYMGGRAEFFPMLTSDFEMYPDRLADGGLYPFSARPPAVVETMQAAARADAPNMIANVVPSEPDLEARLRAGARVLDAGCGAGYGLLAFADAYPAAELVGIEIDEASIAAARRRAGDRVCIEQLDLRDHPFHEEFDVVYANISISHTWGSSPPVFAALVGALKPGGWLLVSDVPYPEVLEDLRSPAGRLFTGVIVYVSLLGFELLTSSRLVACMREAGLERVRVAEQPAQTRMMVVGRRPTE